MGERIKEWFSMYWSDWYMPDVKIIDVLEIIIIAYLAYQLMVWIKNTKAWMLMKCLHEEFHYETGSTTMRTTAEEAFMQRKGVCQDYAHIMIALCHLAKIPARYVAGMMVGEGYSRAWVEILSEDVWYAFDPTHACEAKENYIKIGVGRDAEDCMINKGILKGGGSQTQEIRVLVEELPVEV